MFPAARQTPGAVSPAAVTAAAAAAAAAAAVAGGHSWLSHMTKVAVAAAAAARVGDRHPCTMVDDTWGRSGPQEWRLADGDVVMIPFSQEVLEFCLHQRHTFAVFNEYIW